ncbi:unnamed protein product [Diamesa tonsa]
MKKLELIAVIAITLVSLAVTSSAVSLYSIISDAEQTTNERLPKKLQPVELMVDATNHLGFKVLFLHTNLNKNNIAFSPCGLMSVLVALYEGSNGKSTIELKQALEFPNEKDIVRVGIRDIHRRLRSYFYKKESLLSGLIFNKENITIRSEYETVLRFYGYDLDTTSMLTESNMNESAQMTNATEKEATDSIMTTLSPMNKTEVQQTTTIMSTTTTISSTTSSTTTSKVPDIPETTIVPETTDNSDTTNVEETSEVEEVTTDVPNEETTEENDNDDDDDEDEESVTTTTTEAPPSRKRAVRGRLGRGLKNRRDKKQTSSLTIKSSGQSRKSRSYYVLLDDENIEYENGFNLETSSHASLLGPLPTHPPLSTATAQASGKYLNKNQKDLFENINTDMVEHIFYLNEYETVRVPYKIYDTIMKYAHVDSLQASVIEIDLDTDYYNLIIFVPDYQSGLSDLINKLRLHDSNTLRHIRNQMDAVWVKTIVPKFNLKGNTILTSDLQNLEIVDIFEPSKADFSNLANDKTLYVKNVEQTININIRTQTTQQLKKISSLYKQPIEIPVNVPFVYCVIDRELDMAIIMGRIVNPLNSRIQ